MALSLPQLGEFIGLQDLQISVFKGQRAVSLPAHVASTPVNRLCINLTAFRTSLSDGSFKENDLLSPYYHAPDWDHFAFPFPNQFYAHKR